MMSGAVDPDEVNAAIESGDIKVFMPKPWNPEELLQTVADAVENSNPA